MNKIILFASILVGLNCSALFAQQPWRFHIAFEDGTGQRDTLWMVFDNTATVEGVDYQLGEGTPEYNPNAFNVFMYNMNVDSTKIIAYPYSMYPYIFTGSIYSINFIYPVIIRWDTSLFHVSYLPANPTMNKAIIVGNYPFFMLPIDYTTTYLHTINMLTKDSIFCPEDFNGVQFPLFGDQSLGFAVDHDNYLYLEENKTDLVLFYPNPCKDLLKIETTEPLYDGTLCLTNRYGQIIKLEPWGNGTLSKTLSMGDLLPGVYILTLRDKKQIFTQKIVIN
jgi:hypothetical protein